MLSHFSAFGLLEILRSATGKLFLFTFRTRKQNWKILFLSQMLFENSTQIFNFCTKNWHQQNHEDLGTNWYIGIFFWKAPMLHYHCTKFPVSRISVSRDLSWGTQIGPSSHTLTLIVLKMLRRCLHLKVYCLVSVLSAHRCILSLHWYFLLQAMFVPLPNEHLDRSLLWLLKSLKKLKIIAFHLITYLSCHKKCVVCFTSF